MIKFFFPVLVCCFMSFGMESESQFDPMPPITVIITSSDDHVTKERKIADILEKKSAEESIAKKQHHKRMIVSNTITALLSTCITAGVTLAIHFSECKKD